MFAEIAARRGTGLLLGYLFGLSVSPTALGVAVASLAAV